MKMSRYAAALGIVAFNVLFFLALGGVALAGDCSDPSDCHAPPDNAIAAGCVAGAVACGALIARTKKKDQGGEWDDDTSDFGDGPAQPKGDGGAWSGGGSDFGAGAGAGATIASGGVGGDAGSLGKSELPPPDPHPQPGPDPGIPPPPNPQPPSPPMGGHGPPDGPLGDPSDVPPG
jgi:hypothetical protein